MNSGTGDIRDIKTIESFSSFWQFALIVFILLLLIAITIYIMKKIKIQKEEKNKKLQQSPKEIAMKRLKELQNFKFTSRENFRFFYYSISLHLKQYIESVLTIAVTDMTIEEIKRLFDRLFQKLVVVENKRVLMYQQELDQFLAILRECDLVKFADEIRTEDDAINHLKKVIHFIETIDEKEIELNQKDNVGEKINGIS